MTKLIVVGVGGALGAIARYGISGWMHRLYEGSFPIGTLVANVLGCLLIGSLMSLVEDRGLLSPNARLFWTIGLLGSFTTFSTFGHETLALVRDRQMGLALGSIGANVMIGLGAVWVGRAVTRWAFGASP